MGDAPAEVLAPAPVLDPCSRLEKSRKLRPGMTLGDPMEEGCSGGQSTIVGRGGAGEVSGV